MEPKQSAAEPNSRRKRPASKRPWVVIRSAMSGSAEAEQFESQAEFDQAVHEISRESGTPRSLDWWIGAGCIVAAIVAVRWITKALLRQVNWHPAIEETLLYVAIFGVAVVTIWLLHRWGSREALREKLIGRGIPVCRGCGYSLRGQTAASKACPECGRAIDDDVARILTAYRASQSR